MRKICVILIGLFLLSGCGNQAVSPSPTTVPLPEVAAATPTPTPVQEASPTSLPPTLTPTLAPPPDAIRYENPRKYQVTFESEVKNGTFDLKTLQVYLPKPIDWDEQRDVKIVSVSPSDVTSNKDQDFGNEIYYWELSAQPQPGKTVAFTIAFDLTAYQTVTNIKPEDVRPYDVETPLYKLYTRPERFIESDDQGVVKLAGQIAGAETNPYLLARKFYDYVIDHAKYELLGQGLNGASYLLKEGRGECGDYASLFIALCRAKGIPARPVVGYWAVSGLEQTHVWAEFYLQDFGWIPSDPTIGQQDEKREEYFGKMDNQRVILHKGFNLVVSPTPPDDYSPALLQEAIWWMWGEGDGRSVSMNRTKWEVKEIK